MSPILAMNRSYTALKQLLRAGAYPPGFRLEANRLADELGVSLTPVRDVLHRLVGERLVDANSGEGFHVPRLSEPALRDLYEWNAALVSMAVRTARSPVGGPLADPSPAASDADRASALFAAYGEAALNREIGDAIARASDRLHPFRLLECDILERVEHELESLETIGAGQAQAIRRYHLRRMRAASQLLAARESGPAPGNRL